MSLELVVDAAVQVRRAFAGSASAGDIAGDLCADGLAEEHGGVGVNEGLERTAAVVGDNVEDTRDRATAADLGQGVTTLLHRVLDIFDLVVAVTRDTALGEANVIVGLDVLGPKDGGLDFGDGVGTLAGDDTALDSQGSSVATLAIVRVSCVSGIVACLV